MMYHKGILFTVDHRFRRWFFDVNVFSYFVYIYKKMSTFLAISCTFVKRFPRFIGHYPDIIRTTPPLLAIFLSDIYRTYKENCKNFIRERTNGKPASSAGVLNKVQLIFERFGSFGS